MPEPLSPKIGLGMNVTVLPCACATPLMMYLNSISRSAVFSSVPKRMLISAWPGLPTSWCCISTWMPASIRARVISERRSA